MVATPTRKSGSSRNQNSFKQGDEVKVFHGSKQKKGVLMKLCAPKKGLKRFTWQVQLGPHYFIRAHVSSMEPVEDACSDDSTTMSVTPVKTEEPAVLGGTSRRCTRSCPRTVSLHDGLEKIPGDRPPLSTPRKFHYDTSNNHASRTLSNQKSSTTKVLRIELKTGTLILHRGRTPRRAEFYWNK